MKVVAVSDIKWDTDGEAVDLPKTVHITESYLVGTGDVERGAEDEEMYDAVADILSDAYGWCVSGFSCDTIEVSEDELQELREVLN